MARLENLLGAQALALTDRLLAADGVPAAGASVSERAALVTLLAHPDHSVSWLGGVLGLTSSGITRLVDRLVAAGWVTRTPGDDARSRRVQLTRAGRQRARDVLHARRAAMADALVALSESDRTELERLLVVIVGSLAETRLRAMQICRLCDRSACASDGRECPLEHTVSVHPGPPVPADARVTGLDNRRAM
jgi:DNA-binding MarR family transcriptional regulator